MKIASFFIINFHILALYYLLFIECFRWYLCLLMCLLIICYISIFIHLFLMLLSILLAIISLFFVHILKIWDFLQDCVIDVIVSFSTHLFILRHCWRRCLECSIADSKNLYRLFLFITIFLHLSALSPYYSTLMS